MLCGLVYWYQCSRAVQLYPGDRGSRFPQTYQIPDAISHKTKSHNMLLIKEVEFRNEHCGSVSHSLPQLVGPQS